METLFSILGICSGVSVMVSFIVAIKSCHHDTKTVDYKSYQV